MAVKTPRRRIVNFRVSEGEFQELTDATKNSGARSMSDHARTRVLEPKGLGTGSRIEELTENVRLLHEKFNELFEILTEPVITPSAQALPQTEEVVNGVAH